MLQSSCTAACAGVVQSLLPAEFRQFIKRVLGFERNRPLQCVSPLHVLWVSCELLEDGYLLTDCLFIVTSNQGTSGLHVLAITGQLLYPRDKYDCHKTIPFLWKKGEYTPYLNACSQACSQCGYTNLCAASPGGNARARALLRALCSPGSLLALTPLGRAVQLPLSPHWGPGKLL